MRSCAVSAIRALDILGEFRRLRRPLRAVELVDALGFPTSSTDQLLKSLVESGHLIFNRRAKTYFPSARLSPFGSWMSGLYFGEDRISRALEEISVATGE